MNRTLAATALAGAVAALAGCGGSAPAASPVQASTPVASPTPTVEHYQDLTEEQQVRLDGAVPDLAIAACHAGGVDATADAFLGGTGDPDPAGGPAEFVESVTSSVGFLADGLEVPRSIVANRLLVETLAQCGDEYGTEINILLTGMDWDQQ